MKGVEHEDVQAILDSVASLPEEQRLSSLASRLASSEKELRAAKEKAATADKLNKEKAALEKKLLTANSVLMKAEEKKDKLQELCRGLQNLNKEMRDENVARAKKMEADREQMVNQLKSSMKEIEKSMDDGRVRSQQVAEENARLSSKLAELAADYETRLNLIQEQFKQKEKYCEEMVRAKDVELDLYKTKLEASGLIVQKLQIEKETLNTETSARANRVDIALENERLLKEQIKEYGERYAALNKSLDASNDTFTKFREQMDKISTQLKRVEKESGEWRKKFEAEQKALVKMSLEKKELLEKAALRERQVLQLEKLCRALRKGHSDTPEHLE